MALFLLKIHSFTRMRTWGDFINLPGIPDTICASVFDVRLLINVGKSERLFWICYYISEQSLVPYCKRDAETKHGKITADDLVVFTAFPPFRLSLG